MTAYIQYKGNSSKTYNTQLWAQRNPFNLQSSPKCCLVLSNRNIYIPCTHTPQIVRTTYLIEMSYTQLCARRAQRNPFNLQSSPKCCLVLSNRNICTFIFLVIAPTDELYIPIIYPHFAYIYNHVANNYKVHLQNVTSVYNAIYG